MSSLDKISAKSLLWTNALLCLFVLIAHGGALLMVSSGKAPEMAKDIGIAYISIPMALLGLVFAAIGLIHVKSVALALRVHALVLLGLAGYMTYFGISSAIGGLPTGERFVWNPVLFASILGYPVLLLQRAFPRAVFSSGQFRYAPLVAVGVSALISAGIFWRIGTTT